MTAAEAREHCRSLFLETLDSLQVPPRLRQTIKLHKNILAIGDDSYPLSKFRDIRIVSFGKAALEMAETAAEILGSEGRQRTASLRGIVVSPSPATQRPILLANSEQTSAGRASQCFAPRPAFQYFHAGHPYPDEGSWKAAVAVIDFLEDCSPNDLVLFLISGGGSALLEKPLHSSINLEDLRKFYEVLVTCGIGIKETNILRKHFSAVKGGRLALQASPAAQVTLFVSDVPEHLSSTVASGPTMPDQSTVEDCRLIVSKKRLLEKFPASIRALLESGDLPETPKPGDPRFARSRYYCLMSNRDGVEKLAQLARAKGFCVEIDAGCDDWHFQRAADYLLARLEALRKQNPKAPVLLVSGGELSSPVPEGGTTGRGGRNQAFVLHCVGKIAGRDMVVLSAGTDGFDGNSPASGAIADGGSARRAEALGLDAEKYLAAGDSYSFFEKLNDAIVTGPTGTNVRDLRLLLAYSRPD